MVGGSYTDLDVVTARAGDVLADKVIVDKDGNPLTGTMVDKSDTAQSASASLDTTNSRVQMTVPATGKYNTVSKLYATYATIRSLIGLTAAKIATGTTILGVDGTYKGLGDAAVDNVLAGKRFSTATISNGTGAMTDRGAVDVSLNPGSAHTVAKGYHNGNGKVKAKSRYVKSISAMAVRGFGAPSGDYELDNEESFTMPENGTVYYSGMSASYNQAGNIACEIRKNGSVVDHRNIDSDNRYHWRATMYNKSFSAVKGDVITVKAAATSGTHAMATIDAVIVYFV